MKWGSWLITCPVEDVFGDVLDGVEGVGDLEDGLGRREVVRDHRHGVLVARRGRSHFGFGGGGAPSWCDNYICETPMTGRRRTNTVLRVEESTVNHYSESFGERNFIQNLCCAMTLFTKLRTNFPATFCRTWLNSLSTIPGKIGLQGETGERGRRDREREGGKKKEIEKQRMSNYLYWDVSLRKESKFPSLDPLDRIIIQYQPWVVSRQSCLEVQFNQLEVRSWNSKLKDRLHSSDNRSCDDFSYSEWTSTNSAPDDDMFTIEIIDMQ